MDLRYRPIGSLILFIALSLITLVRRIVTIIADADGHSENCGSLYAFYTQPATKLE